MWESFVVIAVSARLSLIISVGCRNRPMTHGWRIATRWRASFQIYSSSFCPHATASQPGALGCNLICPRRRVHAHLVYRKMILN